jgi:L-lactate dehydrogenase complex protein LldF
MKTIGAIFLDERRFRAAQRLGRMGESLLPRKHDWITWMPGLLGGWTQARDLHLMPKETFRDWWEKRDKHVQ